MKLAKYRLPTGEKCVGLVEDDNIVPLSLSGTSCRTLQDILETEHPSQTASSMIDAGKTAVPLNSVALQAPIDRQEVWAAGVTYKRSRVARMEESEAAASCYDRVYDSPRPEIFFKATPSRVSDPGKSLRIRVDSKWNVPEPEITLVLNSRMALVGFTIGNDMSSRDIEGENPLYLPQAKVYDACCGLGPCITFADAMPAKETIGIELTVRRGEGIAYHGTTDVGKMARSFEDLIDWLSRENSFPQGVFLLTGTGIVPDAEFTLNHGDTIDIRIDGIGTLSNPVVQGSTVSE